MVLHNNSCYNFLGNVPQFWQKYNLRGVSFPFEKIKPKLHRRKIKVVMHIVVMIGCSGPSKLLENNPLD